MPTVWVQFPSYEDSERAIGRLAFAGFERDRIDRIEGADGRWRVGIYVDERDAPRVRAIMSDREAPTSTDVLHSLLIFGTAALAGLALALVVPRRVPPSPGRDGGKRAPSTQADRRGSGTGAARPSWGRAAEARRTSGYHA